MTRGQEWVDSRLRRGKLHPKSQLSLRLAGVWSTEGRDTDLQEVFKDGLLKALSMFC